MIQISFLKTNQSVIIINNKTPKPKVTKRKKAPITDAVKTLVGREDVTEYETPAETRKKKETKRKLSPSVILDLFAEERDRLVKEEKEK